MLKLVFWILLSAILYTYIGYALVLLILNGFKKIFFHKRRVNHSSAEYPEVSLLIAAYNEKDVIEAKMENTLAIDYPADKLNVVWVSDGSTDGSHELLKQYPGIVVLHEQQRMGKTAAINRAMKTIRTPFVVFSDANTMLDKNAIKKLISFFSDEEIGCVAGEKRIARDSSDNAAGAGEGVYWQYESYIKRLESSLYSALAAAGELYAIRTSLFSEVDPTSIIDDFVISTNITLAGYRIKYAPDAFALESPSVNIGEELKRKIRIASGGVQTIMHFPSLLNIFKHPILSFEFISHKLLRWLVVPFAIPVILILNGLLCLSDDNIHAVYFIIMAAQGLFYLFVIIGLLAEIRGTRARTIFLPYYIIIMNYAQVAGIFRYLRRKHTVVWEKAKRA
jgi:cellulose synthase/poly-beta-1,6-N-acetylglucosamine synthase-like glycosyltransferase